MTATAEKPPLALSLLLLVAGVAALATAVLLVWSRFDLREPVAPAAIASLPAATAGQAAGPEPVTETDPPVAVPANEVPPGPPHDGRAGPGPAPTIADAGPAAAGGPWRLSLDPRNYAPDETGEAAIAEIAALLAANPSARVRLLGVNNNRMSEKRALQAARTVRNRLVAAGVERRHCEVEADQEAGFEGLEVRIEIEGGSR